jgi:hypothetical protein
MNVKSNFQSLFLNKSVKRGTAVPDKPAVAKGKSTTNKLIVNPPKFKPLNLMFAPTPFEKKPLFRITSLSQNMLSTTKHMEKDEKEEPAAKEESVIEKINITQFKYEMVIGKGGFGKVESV